MTQPPLWVLQWTVDAGGALRRVSSRRFKTGDPVMNGAELGGRLRMGHRTNMVSAWTEDEAWADIEAMVARDRGLATETGDE
jgi:hypothetical protein